MRVTDNREYSGQCNRLHFFGPAWHECLVFLPNFAFGETKTETNSLHEFRGIYYKKLKMIKININYCKFYLVSTQYNSIPNITCTWSGLMRTSWPIILENMAVAQLVRYYWYLDRPSGTTIHCDKGTCFGPLIGRTSGPVWYSSYKWLYWTESLYIYQCW